VISFNGKKGDWDAWEEKFLAKARHKGYKDLLLGKLKIPVDFFTLDLAKDADKAKIAL
jgi:hypothetical protein